MTNPFEQIADIKARRLAFLEEMCAHYNNTNRATTEDGFCFYEAKSYTRGCAIGAWVPELSGCSGTISFLIRQAKVQIPEWMMAMGVEFLSGCQYLHDRNHHWTDTGLSQDGLDCKQRIIDSHTV